METAARNSILMKPGVTDFCCAVLLAIVSALGVALEPSQRDFWLILPSSIAALLVVTGALLALNVRAAAFVAILLHVMLLASSVLCILLCLFLFVTILFFGLGLVLLPPAVLLTVNSSFTLWRIKRARMLDQPARGLSLAN